jgi:hypothetical protein
MSMGDWDNLVEPTRGALEALLRKGDAMADRIEELEAKLAKAVELALEECPFRWGTPNYDKWWHHRRTTLAELKGETDE